ncbi:MAG: hypothetical protein IJU58_01710 [Clostridia bacterium]|nr:hypothetical protein [Clostridia bacterium]
MFNRITKRVKYINFYGNTRFSKYFAEFYRDMHMFDEKIQKMTDDECIKKLNDDLIAAISVTSHAYSGHIKKTKEVFEVVTTSAKYQMEEEFEVDDFRKLKRSDKPEQREIYEEFCEWKDKRSKQLDEMFFLACLDAYDRIPRVLEHDIADEEVPRL